MKFTITLLLILLATSAFSYSISNEFSKRDYNSSKCQMNLDKSKDCAVQTLTNDNIIESCIAFKTERCQKFYENGVKSVVPCSSLSADEISKKQQYYDDIRAKLTESCKDVESIIPTNTDSDSQKLENNNTPTPSSNNASSIKYSGALIITLSLILYILL